MLSNADMFDKTLPSYLSEYDPELEKENDCVDLCTKHYMTKVMSSFLNSITFFLKHLVPINMFA